MGIRRPADARRQERMDRENKFQLSGLNPVSDEAAKIQAKITQADAVYTLIQSEGWKVIAKRMLTAKEEALDEFQNASTVSPDRCVELRHMVAGIGMVERIIQAVLQTGEEAEARFQQKERI